MTEDDRAYYRARYDYAVRMAEESGDASARAVHLVMAAEYRQRAAPDDEPLAVLVDSPPENAAAMADDRRSTPVQFD